MPGVENTIYIKTRDLARRMNTYKGLRAISMTMLWGSGAAILLVCVSKFVIIPITVIPSLAIILGMSIVIGVIRGILYRVSAFEASIAADAQLDTKERFSSALELLQDQNRSGMAELQLEDAASFAQSLDPEVVCPRVFPITAKFLPVSLLLLITLIFIPSLYSRSAEVSPEVRQAIRQSGAEMEGIVKEIDRESLSEELAKLASEMEATGRRMQSDPITKKEALRDLSNLTRKIQALMMIGEASQQLAGDMTPEKKRLLNDLLEKLADNLKDLPEMGEISRKILQAKQANLSVEALQELSIALEQLGMGASDIKALRQMSNQVAKGKQDIGSATLATTAAQDQTQDQHVLMGGDSPGKETAGESTAYSPRKPIPPGRGVDLELEGQVSEGGRSVSLQIESDTGERESSVPYEDIYVKYRDAADDAMTRTNIPWTYREHVKNYFDAIRPGK